MGGDSEGRHRLTRHLGLVDVYAICTGAMFSSGFFLLPGIAFGMSGKWVVAAYGLSALIVVPAMLSKAELASALPKAGGDYYFLDRSMGPLVGTVGGLGTWLAMAFKNTFALIGLGAYLSLFVEVDILGIAVAGAVGFTAINIVGAKETAALQRWLVYVLVGILTLLLAAGFIEIGVGEGLVATFQRQFGGAPGSSVDGFLATVGLVFVSYAGLTKVAGVAEEVKRPERNILLGMVLSLATAFTFYTVGTLLLVLQLDHGSLATDLTPVASAAERALGWLPGRTGVFLVFLAATAAFASTANAGILSASRYLLAMGRDHLISDRFGKIGRMGTPTLGVLVTGGFVVVCLLTLDVVSVAKLASSFQLMVFAFVCLAVIVMREARIDTYDPPVRSPFYPWTQLAGIFVSFFLIIELGRLAILFALGIVSFGVVWFFVYAKRRVVREGAVLHWFERLGRGRSDGLELEIWSILKEAGLREGDPFAELLDRAELVELEGRPGFPEVARRVAGILAERVPLDRGQIAGEFLLGVRAGLVPVTAGIAIPHFRIPGLARHELVIARALDGVSVHVGEGHPSGEHEVEVHALFFLLSPEDEAGQHLRILAKLATQAERDDFIPRWRAAVGSAELRALLLDSELRVVAERVAGRAAAVNPTWIPHARAGRFERVLLIANDEGEITTIEERARRLSTDAVSVTRLERPHWMEVVREVVHGRHDLVVLASERRRSQAFDSFAKHLVRKCPCPVWVVPEGSAPGVRRVVAAVDADTASAAHRGLNRRILELASALCRDPDTELHVVYAWHLVGATGLSSRDPGAASSGESVSAERRYYEDRLRKVLLKHGAPLERVHIHLPEGEPEDAIPLVVDSLGAEVLVMGTISRGGISGYLIGNTAEDVLEQVSCSVLAVKPEGFVTPVDVRP